MGFWPLSRLLAPRRTECRALRRANRAARLHLEHLEERRVLSIGGLPVVDNFDRPDSAIISNDWQERAGDFSLLDQRVVSAASGTSLALVDAVIEADVALSAQVDVPAVGIADAGFVARHTAQGEMYVGTLVGRNGRFTAEIWRRHDGRWTNLAYQTSPAGTGKLQFVVQGQSLRLLLDGQQVAEAIDDVLQAAGEVGLRASGSATYDDLHIDRLTTPDNTGQEEDDPPAVTLPLIDPFDRPDDAEISPAWRELAGDFSLLAQRVVSADSGTSLALLAGVSEVDVSLSAEVEVPSVGVADAGFMLRRTEAGEMYVGTLVGRNGRFTAEIWRRHDGRWTNLAYEALSTGSGRLQFIAQGSSLRLLLDGQQVAQADDDVLSEAGRLGLRASGGAAYDELRIERWLITAIGHTIEDVTTVQLDWTPLLEVTSYHVIVTNDETGEDVFRGQLQGTALRLQLNEGSYTARVAAAEMPFAVHAFDVVFPEGGLSALSHEVLDSDTVRLTWSTVQGASAYHTIVTNTDTQVEIYRGWVYDTSLDLSLAAGSYKARVAFSGSPYRPYVFDVTAFLPGTFTPLSPIGPTNRQENHFTWFAVPDAVAYRFELRGVDGTVIDSHRVEQATETTATVPPGEYQWRVIAIGSRGEETMDVAWYSFSVVQAALDRENILGIEPDATVPANLVVLNVPQTAIRASDGTVYIADTLSNVIRRARNGQVDVFAGTLEAGYNGDGYRTDVMLSQPAELIFDADENLLVVDTGNNLIRKIDLDTGQVTTVMGLPGQKAMPTDGQAASDSPLGWTTALIYDAQGNLYIPTSVDRDGVGDGDSRLFYISPDGIVHESSVILPGQVSDIRVGEDVIEIIYKGTFQRIFNDGTRQTDKMPSEFGGGIVYRAETNTTLVGNHSSIFEFDADFNRTTFVRDFANVADINETEDGFLIVDGDRGAIIEFDRQGREIPGRSIGSTSTQGTSAIVDVARYDDDTLLFLENKKGYIYSYSISTGRTVVMAGNGRLEMATLGVDQGLTGFWYPNAIAVDSRGNVYITENNRIVKIDSSGRTSLFAGDIYAGDSGEGGAATAARFRSIRDIAFDDHDTMYVADMYNNKIKTISPDGIVTTIAGSGIAGSGSAGANQFDKPAVEANLNHPSSVLPQADGTVLFSNAWSNTLGRIDADGMLRHVAGVERRATYQDGGLYRGDGGLATEAYLNTPHGLAVSPSGVIYFADTFNHVIRSIDTDGIISTVWGRGSRGFATDGSLLSYPMGIFLVSNDSNGDDSNGDDLFITDNGNGLVSRIRAWTDDAERYTHRRSVAPIAPLENVPLGVVEFRFDRDPLDYAYYFQLYHASGEKVWQGYVYANSWQTELASGDYRWRVTPLAKIDGKFVFAPPNDWVEFSVENESKSFRTILDSLVGINLKSRHLSGEEFSYEMVSNPSQGTLLGGVTDALRTYRPNDGFVGDDGFTYRVRNEAGQSVLVNVQLNVRQPDHPSRSYFVPGFGTIGVAQGTPAAPVFTGAQLPTELVVSSGLGNVIEKFGTDGQIQWRYHKSATWPGVAVYGDQVIFNDFKSIFFLDLETGALERELEFDTTIEFVSPQEEGLLIGLRGEEKQTIVLWNEQQGVVWTNPHDVLFPRWADMRGDLIVVADTLNHRFYGVDRNTGEMTFSVEAVFPNDVRFTADNEILLVEEHADRVWKYNIDTGIRTWVFGAGNGMENLALSAAEIRTINNGLRIDPDDPQSKSKSSKTYSGPITLYAPNGAVQLPDGSYYIADTDNHRVVHVSADGQLLAELEGFNNPNKVAFVP